MRTPACRAAGICTAAIIALTAATTFARPAGPPPGPPGPKPRPKPRRENVKFVSLDLTKKILQVKNSAGQVVSFSCGKMTIPFRNMKVVKPEQFNAKPGEPLVICYWPGTGGLASNVYAIFDQKSTVFIRELERPPVMGLLDKVKFSPTRIWVKLASGQVKTFTLGDGSLVLRSMGEARFRGDPTIKPPKKGERDENTYFEPGKDTVFVVTTLDGKEVRLAADWSALSLIRQLAAMPPLPMPVSPNTGK